MTTARSPFLLLTIFIITFQSQILDSNSQQQYLNNNQLDCNNNYKNTYGFVCNANQNSCNAYVTFRSSLPNYNSPPSIAYLLGLSNPSAIAQLNNISDVATIPEGRLVVVPVSCSCTPTRVGRYYQHNAKYTLKEQTETYFTTANNTYQGLTTCQAMMAQNRFNYMNLTVGEQLTVPIMCACPTAEQQKKYGAKYLVSYLVTWGDDISQIAGIFGADMQSVLDANELNPQDVIYPFTPILVPLKSALTKINLPSSPPTPTPQSNPNPVNPTGSGGSSKKGVYVGVGIGAGVLVICGCSFFAWFCLRRPSTKPVSTVQSEARGDNKDPESAEYTALPGSYPSSQTQTTKSCSTTLDGFKSAIESLTVYKFSELEEATEKFSEAKRIKGSVYRGAINGDDVAIKILKGNVPSNEINLLKHINHSNIIRLSGYCIREGNTYLVYEFAERGSLDDWLFRQEKHQSEDDSLSQPALGWKQRVQIACNVADALNYIHRYVDPPYIHKNLKSSNILLDSNFRAKITNFGLARTFQNKDENGVLHLTKHIVGTHGYLAPEYIENGVVTEKLDVFAFGVLVLELLSGKPAVRPSGNNKGGTDDLLFVVIRNMFEGEHVREKLTSFMDYNLGREYPLDLAYSMAQLAYKCVDRDINSRPSMSEVSMTLSKIYSSSLDWDPSDELANSSSLSHSR